MTIKINNLTKEYNKTLAVKNINSENLKNITTTVINPIDSIGYQSKKISE